MAKKFPFYKTDDAHVGLCVGRTSVHTVTMETSLTHTYRHTPTCARRHSYDPLCKPTHSFKLLKPLDYFAPPVSSCVA